MIPEGTFIIADIMLKNDYKYTSTILKQMFVGLASELIYIPEKNLISKRKWLKNIKKCEIWLNDVVNCNMRSRILEDSGLGL